MNFQKILAIYLKRFESSVIYDRGKGYYTSGMVHDLEYNDEQNQILAQVEGSQGDFYTLKIKLKGQNVDTDCSCLYEGSPCKHIIATMLMFLGGYQKYVNQAKENRQKLEQVKNKLNKLSKADLVDLVLNNAAKWPEYKRDLLIKFGDNNDSILKMISKNIEGACRSFEAGNENSPGLGMELESISESVKESDSKIRLHASWMIANKVIGFFNEFGIGYDDALEDIISENLETVTELLKENKNDRSSREMVLKGLLAHYLKHNSGVMDNVLEAIFDNCIGKSDYEVLISETERTHRDLKGDDPYHKNLAEDLMQDLKDMRDEAYS